MKRIIGMITVMLVISLASGISAFGAEAEYDYDTLVNWGIRIASPDGTIAVLDGNDYYIYAEEDGYIPYVRVNVYNGYPDNNEFEFLDELTAYMIGDYDDLEITNDAHEILIDEVSYYEADYDYTVSGQHVRDRRIAKKVGKRIYLFASKEVEALDMTIGNMLEEVITNSSFLDEDGQAIQLEQKSEENVPIDNIGRTDSKTEGSDDNSGDAPNQSDKLVDSTASLRDIVGDPHDQSDNSDDNSGNPINVTVDAGDNSDERLDEEDDPIEVLLTVTVENGTGETAEKNYSSDSYAYIVKTGDVVNIGGLSDLVITIDSAYRTSVIFTTNQKVFRKAGDVAITDRFIVFYDKTLHIWNDCLADAESDYYFGIADVDVSRVEDMGSFEWDIDLDDEPEDAYITFTDRGANALSFSYLNVTDPESGKSWEAYMDGVHDISMIHTIEGSGESFLVIDALYDDYETQDQPVSIVAILENDDLIIYR